MRDNQAIINDKSNHKVIYFGRDMQLSRKEYLIFCCIEDSEDEYISAEKIIEACYYGKKPAKGDITTHVCHINTKARNINKCPVIKSRYGVGYKIDDTL